MATEGDRHVGGQIGSPRAGDLVRPNPLHDRIGGIPGGEGAGDCRPILQLTGEFVAACMAAGPEPASMQPLLDEALWGVGFDACRRDRRRLASAA